MEISNEAIGLRLRIARIALRSDLSQAQFADWLGIATTTWNGFEKGARRIPVEDAAKLAQKTGVTLDWIYRGMDAYLPSTIRAAIEDATTIVKNAPPDARRRA